LTINTISRVCQAKSLIVKKLASFRNLPLPTPLLSATYTADSPMARKEKAAKFPPLRGVHPEGIHPEGRIEVGFSLPISEQPHPNPLLLGEGDLFPLL